MHCCAALSSLRSGYCPTRRCTQCWYRHPRDLTDLPAPCHAAASAALRCAAGSLIAALADRLQAHRALLVGTFLACIAAQGAMAAVSGFPAMLVLTVAASAVWTPSSIIADASVMAAADHVSLACTLR